MKTYREGLADAARHLRGVAQDYEQMAAQVRTGAKSHQLGYSAEMNKARKYTEQAALLRGQADQIEQLP